MALTFGELDSLELTCNEWDRLNLTFNELDSMDISSLKKLAEQKLERFKKLEKKVRIQNDFSNLTLILSLLQTVIALLTYIYGLSETADKAPQQIIIQSIQQISVIENNIYVLLPDSSYDDGE